jgi:hypothetical protein
MIQQWQEDQPAAFIRGLGRAAEEPQLSRALAFGNADYDPLGLSWPIGF